DSLGHPLRRAEQQERHRNECVEQELGHVGRSQVPGPKGSQGPVRSEPEDDHPGDELGSLTRRGGLAAAGGGAPGRDDPQDRYGPDPRIGEPFPCPVFFEGYAPPREHSPSPRMYSTRRSTSSSRSENWGIVAR